MTSPCCSLQYAAGRIERCPEEECPFWVNGGCRFAGLETLLDAEPKLVDRLLRIRQQVAGREPRSLFFRLV